MTLTLTLTLTVTPEMRLKLDWGGEGGEDGDGDVKGTGTGADVDQPSIWLNIKSQLAYIFMHNTTLSHTLAHIHIYSIWICMYASTLKIKQLRKRSLHLNRIHSIHSYSHSRCPSPSRSPLQFPLPLPFSVISQIESNDVPSMSKNTFSFCLPGHIYAWKALTVLVGGISVYACAWPSQVQSTFFAALSDFGTSENQQNKRRNSNLLEAQTYKLLCVVLESTNGQRWSVSLAGSPKLCEGK